MTPLTRADLDRSGGWMQGVGVKEDERGGGGGE